MILNKYHIILKSQFTNHAEAIALILQTLTDAQIGVIKDIKKRDMYFDVYVSVGDKVITASTSNPNHKVGQTVGIWVKPEKVVLLKEEIEDTSNIEALND